MHVLNLRHTYSNVKANKKQGPLLRIEILRRKGYNIAGDIKGMTT